MKAILNNYRQSPRKMRLVAGVVKGKTVAQARTMLSLLPKSATVPLKKLLESAVSNAKENQKILEPDALVITDFRVDPGGCIQKSPPPPPPPPPPPTTPAPVLRLFFTPPPPPPRPPPPQKNRGGGGGGGVEVFKKHPPG